MKTAGKNRVLIVIRQFFPLAAGAETQALRQARSYLAMGYSACVVTARHDRSLPVEALVDGVDVTRLATSNVRFVGSILFLLHLAWHLVTHRADYDSVLAFHMKQPAMLAALVCGFLGKRVIISDQAAGEYGDIEALRNAPLGGLVLWGCKKASAFVSGSSDITEELESARIPPAKISFIPNGIPLDAFSKLPEKAQARAALTIAPDAFVAVNIGRHAAQKDLKTLLAAWGEFAGTNERALLVLVGDGDEHQALERLVDERGLRKQVRFEGWRSNVRDYLGAADVFASSSISEGTHIALGEALAAGLPVIATRVGGARDFLQDGQNGFLAAVGDSTAIARRLGELAADKALRTSMGKAALLTARRELAQEQTALQHIQLLFPARRTRPRRRRIRVTHVISTLDRGGSERQMAKLAAGLDKRRFAVRVISLTRGGPTAEILEKAGIPYRILGKSRKADLLSFLRLFSEFLRAPGAIVHTWLFTSNLYGRVAARLAGIRRLVASERSTDPWKSPWHRAVDALLSRFTEATVANSAAVAQSLRANAAGVHVRVIPNGVDAERFHPQSAAPARRELGLPEEGRLLGYIGRLAFEKRPEVFIAVAKEVLATDADARAVLFGDGPMRAELKTLAAPFAQRIIFYGDCPRVELAHAALDCLVLTSQWEGFPNVLLEAMASARPVVAVRMPATEELVTDTVTGILVDDDVKTLAAAVLKVLSNPESALRMAAAARREVVERYSMERMVEAYERLYTQTPRAARAQI